MTEPMTVPVPLTPLKQDVEDRRLWIGNLDPRITDLVKLLQTYGSLEKFDMLFHRSGPLEGQPRGYAFVTYTTKEAAIEAKKHVDGKLVGNKNICVKWAHNLPKNESGKQKIVPDILALGGTKPQNKLSRTTAIKAIEAKLKMMENGVESSDFRISDKPTLSQTVSASCDQHKFKKTRFANRPKTKQSNFIRRKI